MQAIVYETYGLPDVLTVKHIKKPIPQPNEILIKVKATSVNYGDLIARNFKDVSPKQFNMPWLFWVISRLSFRLNKPKQTVLGNSFSGVVEAVGQQVKQFKKGDSVFGYTGEKMGAYAEYLCLSDDGILTHKPKNMTYEEASVVPYGALMAMSLLGKMAIKKRTKTAYCKCFRRYWFGYGTIGKTPF